MSNPNYTTQNIHSRQLCFRQVYVDTQNPVVVFKLKWTNILVALNVRLMIASEARYLVLDMSFAAGAGTASWKIHYFYREFRVLRILTNVRFFHVSNWFLNSIFGKDGRTHNIVCYQTASAYLLRERCASLIGEFFVYVSSAGCMRSCGRRRLNLCLHQLYSLPSTGDARFVSNCSRFLLVVW